MYKPTTQTHSIFIYFSTILMCHSYHVTPYASRKTTGEQRTVKNPIIIIGIADTKF